MNLISSNFTPELYSLNFNNSIDGLFNCVNKNSSTNITKTFDNLAAYNIDPAMMGNVLNFDSVMDKIANFKDILCTLQDSMTQMQYNGEGIKALIDQAHDENISDETVDKINSEIAEKIANINDIFNNTSFNGINPFEKPFEINIPDWRDIVRQFSGAEEGEENEDEISQLIADIDVNIGFSAEINGKSFNMEAGAKIKIGYCDDGSLQISVDASMDFDLSGIIENGADSDTSMDIINEFLNMLGVNQTGLSPVSNVIDNLLGTKNQPDIQFEQSGETQLQGKILQHATIKLDGAYQAPSIAINIL